MRILIVGAGSTGGYFGGRLAEAGRDVTFLVRPARAAHLRAHGLQILSPHGDVTLHPALVTAGEIASPYDVVIVTVKAYALDGALADATPAIGPGTMVLPLLNGMKHVDALTARFGPERVIGGVCKVAATLDGEGRVRQLAGFQELSYGELSGGPSARIAALDAILQGGGFAAKASDAIVREMWEKWLMLAALGGINCLLRGTIGEIEAAPGGAETAARLFDECVAVAAASGHAPGEDYLGRTRAMLTTPGSSQTSSMYRDLQAGNPVEAEQIVGDLLARATGFGQHASLLAAAYASLCVYQERLTRG